MPRRGDLGRLEFLAEVDALSDRLPDTVTLRNFVPRNSFVRIDGSGMHLVIVDCQSLAWGNPVCDLAQSCPVRSLSQRCRACGIYWRVSIEVCSARRACSRSSSAGSGLGLEVGISASFQDRLLLLGNGVAGRPGWPETVAGDSVGPGR